MLIGYNIQYIIFFCNILDNIHSYINIHIHIMYGVKGTIYLKLVNLKKYVGGGGEINQTKGREGEG